MTSTKTYLSDMKTCFKCGVEKTLTEFYPHPRMADGHLGKCKECTKRDASVHRAQKLEVIRAYDRSRGNLPHRVAARAKYSATDAGREASNRGKAAYLVRNPDKRSAHFAVSNAIRDGKLSKKPCERCGSVAVQAHHEDYTKPLEVIWLCVKHHNARHRELRQSQGGS